MIDKYNIKSELIRYFEGYMDESESKAFEQILNQDPALQEELSNLEKTKLKPESNIRFPYKTQLKKQGGTNLTLFSTYTRVAAVTLIGLLILLVSSLLFNNAFDRSNMEVATNLNSRYSSDIMGGQFAIPKNTANQLQKVDKSGLNTLSMNSQVSNDLNLKGPKAKIDQDMEITPLRGESIQTIGQVETAEFQLSTSCEREVKLTEIDFDAIDKANIKLPQPKTNGADEGFFKQIKAKILNNKKNDEREIIISLEGKNLAINGKINF